MAGLEKGCRSGRRRGGLDERLAANEQARRELRTKQMKSATNWPTAA